MIVSDNHGDNCDATVRSITLEPSIMLLESSYMLLWYLYGKGITHDDHHMMIVIRL